MRKQSNKLTEELPSLLLLLVCYGAFGSVTFFANQLGMMLSVALLVPVLVLHSSLQHEIIHGHPTKNEFANDLLVFPPLGLFIPYLRFKDMHLAHHHDPCLTDPYDDPESNYRDPAVWSQLPKWRQVMEQFNNTLLGRMVLGPLISLFCLYQKDAKEIALGDGRILRSYLHHLAGILLVGAWWWEFSTLSLTAYVAAAYLALSVLKIRTFLEHQAHERVAARSVLIEDRGIFSLLFLNNNYHALHHACPKVVWHRLPKLYQQRRDLLLKRNGGYWYRSYWSVFCLYLFRNKDPVPHPLMDADGAKDLAQQDQQNPNLGQELQAETVGP